MNLHSSGKAFPLSFVFVATVSILFVMLIKVLAVEGNNACSNLEDKSMA